MLQGCPFGEQQGWLFQEISQPDGPKSRWKSCLLCKGRDTAHFAGAARLAAMGKPQQEEDWQQHFAALQEWGKGNKEAGEAELLAARIRGQGHRDRLALILE